MFRRRNPLFMLVAAALSLAVWLLSRPPGSALANAELSADDFLLRHGGRTPGNPQLHFLAIDNDSMTIDAKTDLKTLFGITDAKTLEGRALGNMSAHWPWPRSIYALILERLLGAGARVVVFDLNFPTPSEEDGLFRAALERYRDRVVVGSNFVVSDSRAGGAMGATLTVPTPTLIPQTTLPDSRVGFVNFWPDADGIIRAARFRINFSQFLGASPKPGEGDYFSLAAQAVRKFGRPELIPRDLEAHTFRMTAAAGEGFAPKSIYEIFAPEYWRRNYASGAVFKDAIVVIGASGNWQHDEHQTAFGLMPGPEVQLNVINALLHGDFVRSAPWGVAFAAWVLTALAAAAICSLVGAPLLRIGLVLLAGSAFAGVALVLFDRAAIFIPIVGPLAVLGTTALFSIIFDLARSVAEQIRLRKTLADRKRAQELLQTANEELERRVQERTTELSSSNKALSTSLQEKDILLKEIHHRVKNNLQIISSLLNLQSNYIKDPQALQVFTESRYRVRSMALIHEKLYQSHDLSRIDFADYIRALTSGLLATFGVRSTPVRISVEIDQIMLGLDAALPCGLIVNELVTNCFKYAFENGRPGEITISLRPVAGGRLCLRVADDGVGFPKELDFRNTESLGMQIVTTLSEQIDGTIELSNGSGTAFEILFPEGNGGNQ